MRSPSVLATLTRGVGAGLAGTAVMTAFQRLVEQPLTRRPDSHAPAEVAEALLPVHSASPAGRTRLNWVAHFGFGTVWGAGHALASRAGLRGQRAVHVVFALGYPADVLLATALGVYHPGRWSRQDWLVDVLDKYVALQATGFVHDRFLVPRR
ncbi:hypothetical protein [uncultured Modestobacter sp.]|uniref:hypothetical protein n=1 Tax=uncultured Modestobacter sp. TaxID=380048 RepID=UPI00262DF7F8|nr:hypothetical protein [uncultured Modestobacter sp.]